MYAYLYSDKYGCIQKSLEGNPPNLHREACDGGKDEAQKNTGTCSRITYTITCISSSKMHNRGRLGQAIQVLQTELVNQSRRGAN